MGSPLIFCSPIDGAVVFCEKPQRSKQFTHYAIRSLEPPGAQGINLKPNSWPADPSVLKGVAYTWRQEKLAQNAGELRRLGAELYDRVRVFAESYTDAGRNLAKAVDAYNRSAGSWETRLVPSLKRMRELGVGTEDPPQPPRLDAIVRDPQGADRPT